MINPDLNNEQTTEIDENMLLTRQLQKHLGIYTQTEQSKAYLITTLKVSTVQLCNQVNELLQMISKIKKAMQVSNSNKQIRKEEDINELPQFIIKDINKVVIKSQIDISSVANKLKVLVSKTMQKQSSKLKYNFTCYITHVQEELAGEIFNKTFQKMRDELQHLREIFKIVNYEDLIKYKLHQSECAKIPIAAVYVSFYIEQLLFFQGHPLPFNPNLLFVPLVLQKYNNKQTGNIVYTQIIPWYIKQLNNFDSNWENYCFEIIVRDNVKSNVKLYTLISHTKKKLQNQTSSELKKIRCFVYFNLIFNYLKHTLKLDRSSANKNNSIILKLNTKYSLEINTQKLCSEPNSTINHQLTKHFLTYFNEQQIKNRAQKNKEEATKNFINYILCYVGSIKWNTVVPQEYLNLKPKYIYAGDKRVLI